MPERDDMGEELRREFERQAPEFDIGTSLPGKVSARVSARARRRQRLGTVLALGAVAAVVAAIAIPLSSLRSAPVGHTITPATAPTSSIPSTIPSTTTPTTPAVPAFSCNSLDVGADATGTAVSTSVTLGPVTATLTGTAAMAAGNDASLSGAQVAVAVEGGGRFSETVVPPDQGKLVIPWSIAPLPPDASASRTLANGLCLAEFPVQSLPTVVLGLDTGGAHCCTVVRVITVSPTGLGPVVDDVAGNPGATLRSEDGHALIVTADNAFAYAFDIYAGSAMPIKVLEFERGAFVDVTRQHLDLVAQEPGTFMTAFNSNPGNGLGALAAWAADECLLGQGATAWSTVNEFLAQGKLTGPDGWPTGAAYVGALKAFLTQHGYCPS